MYELMQVSETGYYMDCPAKVGFFKISEQEVVLIDSGSDKDAGKKVKKILDAQGWTLRAIYNTHSHADHIGGNQYLQAQTGCKVYAPAVEDCFTAHPILEPTVLYGGFAMEELHSKFLMAKESDVETLTEAALPEGLTLIELPGHSYHMVGFRTKDDVVYLADSLASAQTLQKYQIGYLYDVKAYLNTLEAIKEMQAACFVPSHADAAADIVPLAQLNIKKTRETAEKIEAILSSPKSFDELLSEIFRTYELTMTLPQNMLIGSTLRSYLSYLKNEGRITFFFADDRMLWQKNETP